MLNKTNVLNIQERNTGDDRSLSNTIDMILNELAESSKNTAKNYRSNYREFFIMIIDKEMEFVTWKDLFSITYEDILKYRKDLRKRNINKTINAKVSSLRTLYHELHKIDRRVDVVVVDAKKLPENETKSRSWGSLTEEEVDGLLEHCKLLPNREKPYIKKMFFKTAYVTAIRQGALLKLKWRDLVQVDTGLDNGNQKVWVIRAKDKGKITETPISDELYEELIQLKNVRHHDGFRDMRTDRIFYVTEKTLSRTLGNYCKEVGISEDRNIVLHSLKKASIDKVYSETRDINKTARHGHHANIEMVYQHYQGMNDSILEKPSYTMFNDTEEDLSVLEELSKEELIEVIKKSGMGTINLLKSIVTE